jgi:methylmalonyl-CoA mutase
VNFMKGFFGAGGFEVHELDASPTRRRPRRRSRRSTPRRARRSPRSAPPIERYAGLVPELAPRCTPRGPARSLLAGRPGEAELEYRNAGVDRFVFMGCDAVKTLTELMHEEGALP